MHKFATPIFFAAAVSLLNQPYGLSQELQKQSPTIDTSTANHLTSDAENSVSEQKYPQVYAPSEERAASTQRFGWAVRHATPPAPDQPATESSSQSYPYPVPSKALVAQNGAVAPSSQSDAHHAASAVPVKSSTATHNGVAGPNKTTQTRKTGPASSSKSVQQLIAQNPTAALAQPQVVQAPNGVPITSMYPAQYAQGWLQPNQQYGIQPIAQGYPPQYAFQNFQANSAPYPQAYQQGYPMNYAQPQTGYPAQYAAASSGQQVQQSSAASKDQPQTLEQKMTDYERQELALRESQRTNSSGTTDSWMRSLPAQPQQQPQQYGHASAPDKFTAVAKTVGRSAMVALPITALMMMAGSSTRATPMYSPMGALGQGNGMPGGMISGTNLSRLLTGH